MVKPLQQRCCPLVGGGVAVERMCEPSLSLHVHVNVVNCSRQGLHLIILAVGELDGVQVTLGTGDVLIGRYQIITSLCGHRVANLSIAAGGEDN